MGDWKKLVHDFNIDLNIPAHPEITNLNIPPLANIRDMASSLIAGLNMVQDTDLGLSLTPATPGFEQSDDDVVICSPRSFAAAREARRNRQLIERLNEEPEHRLPADRLQPSCSCQKRATGKQRTRNANLSIKSQGCDKAKWQSEHDVVPQAPPQPKAATFCCPVCMGPFVEETSTKCGHIFCRRCIDAALKSQKKCPTCRRKLRMKDTIRVYLPTSD